MQADASEAVSPLRRLIGVDGGDPVGAQRDSTSHPAAHLGRPSAVAAIGPPEDPCGEAIPESAVLGSYCDVPLNNVGCSRPGKVSKVGDNPGVVLAPERRPIHGR